MFRARLYVPELQPKLLSWYGNSFGQRYFISEGKQTTNLASINLTKLGALPIPVPPINEQHRIVAEIETQFSRLDAVLIAFKRVQANLKRYRASVLQAACTGRLVPTEAELARVEGRSYESADQLLQRILQERRVKWESEQLTAMKADGKIPKDERWKSKYREPAKPDTRELPELPEGWMWATVEQVGHVQLGRQRAPKYHHGEHMRPYLRVANVFEDRIDTTDILHMNFTPEEFRTYCLQHGDVLLNEGQSLELVGRPGMYRDEVPGACFQNTLVRFRSYQGLTSAFALCVFRSYLHNGRFQRIAKWTTNIAHLGAGRFAEIEFPLPPLIEQQRILAEVERRFSIIDELEATIVTNLKRADRLRQAILKRAFEGKLVPQDPTDEPASALLDRIRLERERTTEKPRVIPQQSRAPQPTGQPKPTTPVQGELALGFRACTTIIHREEG